MVPYLRENIRPVEVTFNELLVRVQEARNTESGVNRLPEDYDYDDDDDGDDDGDDDDDDDDDDDGDGGDDDDDGDDGGNCGDDDHGDVHDYYNH